MDKVLEKVMVKGNNCLRCALRCKCPERASCQDHYWLDIKLLGSKEEFLKDVNNQKKKELASKIWSWVEEVYPGSQSLQKLFKWTMEEMHRTLGTKEWPETKETLMYTGPDNFSLGMERDMQNRIKGAWWLLVKYQYNQRYATYKKN